MSVESIVNFAIERLVDLLIAEALFLSDVKSEVQSLQMELTWMKSYLKDAEAREEEGDERFRTGLSEVRRIAYDAEDVIDSFILQAASRRKETRLRRYACAFNCLVRTYEVGVEITSVIERIGKTTQMFQRYQVELNQLGNDIGAKRVFGGGPSGTTQKIRPSRSYPHGDDEHVVGLEKDIAKLVQELTSTENRHTRYLSIVGMGGSGKTTLARKVYNNDTIKQHFQSQAWVSISQEWVPHHILLEILRKSSGQSPRVDEVWSQEVVIEKIHTFLERKLYLVVLDDVWKMEALEDILPVLPSGIKGSKVIITTRKREILQFPDVRYSIHEPQPLNAEEGWQLFNTIVVNHRHSGNEAAIGDEFEKLGRKMLRRCEGLPLAIIALAGLLSSKDTVEEWEKVSESMSSKILAAGRGTHQYGAVKDMLALSYNDLAYELKPCFLYLSLFPEDSEIPTGILTRMWIAEGLITVQQLCRGETLEDVARARLDELVERCVVHVSKRNYERKVKSIQVHDLMRDLCIAKAREQEFLQIFSSRSSTTLEVAIKSRRTSIHSYSTMYFPFPTENEHLRSLFLFVHADVGIVNYYTSGGRVQLSLEPIYKNFRLLRVLLLVGIETCNGLLPEEVGFLVHLRYLGIRVSNIRELPDSIGNLRNLLTLEYRGANVHPHDVKIPNVLWKMERLRHLFLPCGDIRAMEELRLHNLMNLQTLWCLKGDHWMFKELPLLSPSIRKLYIHSIKKMELLQVVLQCPSIKADNLHSLFLSWSDGNLESLEPIYHCKHLYKLFLSGRLGKQSTPLRFPPNVKILRLMYSELEEQEAIEAVGKLQNLRLFDLRRNSWMTTKLICHAGDFPKLEELIIDHLPNLEEWTLEEGTMPRLKKLRLWPCKRLLQLPEGLKFITTLQELELNAMSPEFYRRLKLGGEAQASEEGGEDVHLIQHIPIIRVRD